MRRLLALLAAVLLVASLAGSSVAATPANTISHAYGRFLVGQADRGPIGWVTLDVREPTSANPDPGVFRFEALPGVTDYPVTTRGAIGYVDFYMTPDYEAGFLNALVIAGLEVQYFVGEGGPNPSGRDFYAGFYDLGSSHSSGDFFRYGLNVDGAPDWQEYYVVSGSFTVDVNNGNIE